MTKRVATIDCVPYEGVVARALSAFRTDPTYAVAMARHATTIQSKRAVWAIRLELRAAEAEAHRLCEGSGVRHCVNPSPCGTGQCPFAVGDLRNLHLGETEGKGTRPRESDFPAYSLESAVRPLQALRVAS